MQKKKEVVVSSPQPSSSQGKKKKNKKKTNGQVQVRQTPAPNPALSAAVKSLIASATLKSKEAQLAMDQLVNPSTSPLMRVSPGGNQANTLKSALCRLPNRIHFDLAPLFTKGVSDGPTLGEGDQAVPVWSYSGNDKYYQFVLTDDPIVPLIMPVVATAISKVYTLAKWVGGNQGDSGALEVLKSTGVAAGVLPFSFPVGGSYLTNPGGDYGDMHPIGCSESGVYYFWVDANSQNPAVVQLSGSFQYISGSTVTDVRLSAALLTTSSGLGYPVWTQLVTSPPQNPAGTGVNLLETLNLFQSGYYSFAVTGNASFATNNVGTLITYLPASFVYIYATNVVTRHVVQTPLMKLGDSGAITQVRTLGTSCLWSNVTPNLYKGGNAVGYCASSSTDLWWLRAGDPSSVDTVTDDLYWRGAWTKGVYSYVRPRQYGKIVDCCHQAGRRASFNGDFADPWGWSLVLLQPSLGVSVTLPMSLQLHQACEFWSDNPIFQLDSPLMSVEAYELFVSAALRLGTPFSCNPSHLALIMEAIRGAARTAGHILLPVMESGVRFSKALQSETPFSSSLAVLGL